MVLDRRVCLCYALHTHKCAYTMSVQRNFKQSDMEKRLAMLSRQLYGKKGNAQKTQKYSVSQNVSGSEIQTLKTTENLIVSGSPGNSESFRTDVTFLKHDLSKILILSTIAITAQFLLYFGSRYDFLRIF